MSIGNLDNSPSQSLSDIEAVINSQSLTILQPLNAKGISGFVFDIPENESIQLTSEVTDHYTENNLYINDHIVNKPITITLTGFVGELVYQAEGGFLKASRQIAGTLSQVDGFLGQYSPGFVQKMASATTQASKALQTIGQVVDATKNLVNSVNSVFNGVTTKQQKAFNKLFMLWVNKTLCTIQTPWRYFENFVITNIELKRDGETNDRSEIIVSLKQFRFAELTSVAFDKNRFLDPNAVQSAEEASKGVMTPKKSPTFLQFIGQGFMKSLNINNPGMLNLFTP